MKVKVVSTILALIYLSESLYAATIYVPDAAYGSILIPTAQDVTPSTYVTGLNTPIGAAIDSLGNLYVSTERDNSIYRITPAKVISKFVSNIPTPGAIAFDRYGNLFVNSYSTNSVYRFTPDGGVSTFGSGLRYPTGLAFDLSGNLFVASAVDNWIVKIDMGGNQTVFSAGLNSPSGLAFDDTGTLYAVNTGKGQILRISSDGQSTVFATISSCVGITFDGETGSLFVSDHPGFGSGYSSVWEITGNGTVSQFSQGFSSPGYLTSTAMVPEPSILGFLALGLALFIFTKRRTITRLSDRVSCNSRLLARSILYSAF